MNRQIPNAAAYRACDQTDGICHTARRTDACILRLRLVSGASPAIFDMVIGGEISPEIVMEHIIGSERYAKIS